MKLTASDLSFFFFMMTNRVYRELCISYEQNSSPSFVCNGCAAQGENLFIYPENHIRSREK